MSLLLMVHTLHYCSNISVTFYRYEHVKIGKVPEIAANIYYIVATINHHRLQLVCLQNVTMLTGHDIICLCTSRNKKGSICNKPSLKKKLCLCTITAIVLGHVAPERSSCFM